MQAKGTESQSCSARERTGQMQATVELAPRMGREAGAPLPLHRGHTRMHATGPTRAYKLDSRCSAVHDAPMKTPLPPDRIRLTISVPPEVHETFTRMAAAGSMSVSRAMGDWLADTLDAAQQVTLMMEKARAAPRVVAREMHAYALGLADETASVLAKLREKGAAEAPQARAGARGAAQPPPSPPAGNTGGKVPSEKRKGQRR